MFELIIWPIWLIIMIVVLGKATVYVAKNDLKKIDKMNSDIIRARAECFRRNLK